MRAIVAAKNMIDVATTADTERAEDSFAIVALLKMIMKARAYVARASLHYLLIATDG